MNLQDFRSPIRRLLRNPGYSLTVILLLGLALGANGGAFSVIYGLLYKPLPFAHQEQLVSLGARFMGIDAGVSVPLLEEFAAHGKSIAEAGGYRQESVDLADEAGRLQLSLSAARMQPGVFSLLGAQPLLGRMFNEDDSQQGAARTALVSWSVWQQQFGGSADIVGRTLRLDNGDVRIIGVMPQAFGFPERDTQVWLPLGFSATERAPEQVGRFSGLRAIARLHPGMTLAAADSEMTGLARAMPGMDSAFKREGQFLVNVEPLRNRWLGQNRTALELLLLAMGLVLLVTTANLCNLAIARSLIRRQELAVQEALGASAWQQARQSLIESLMLCAAGAAAGVAMLPGVLGLLRHFELIPANAPQEIGIDAPTLAIIGVLALLVSLAIAFSSLWLRRGSVHAAIRQGGLRQTASRAAQRARNGLIIGQIALTVALLVGIGLLLRSSQQLLAEDVGFDRENLIVATIDDFVPRAASAERSRALMETLLDRARALPGVSVAGFGNLTPFGGNMSLFNFTPPGREDIDPQPTGYKSNVDAGYFQALGMPVLRGRDFSREEARNHAPVAIVDEGFVRRYLGERDPIGLRVRIGDGPDKPMRELTIVGVVATTKQRSLDEATEYVTIHQPDATPSMATLVLRTSGAPQSLVKPLHALFTELSPEGSPGQIIAMDERIAATLAERTRLNTLLQILGAVALTLAMVGLYAVLAYTVRSRTAEFGVRMAMGAGAARVLREVLGHGLKLVGLGLLAGLPLAWIATRMLAARLYGVDAFDPVTLAGVTALLGAVGLAACWLPARRAAATDPIVALRGE
jgi:predicted permease